MKCVELKDQLAIDCHSLKKWLKNTNKNLIKSENNI